MIDLYYKFKDRQEMLDKLSPLGMVTDDAVCSGNHQYSAHEVGEIIGRVGWHLNIRLIDASFDLSAISSYAIKPVNPKCRWA